MPTRITRYRLSLQDVPVDFFADPDGQWEFSALVEMAGFNPEHPGACVGALTTAFDGYPEGAAVITEVGTECRYVAIAQLPTVTRMEKAAARAGTSTQRGISRPRIPFLTTQSQASTAPCDWSFRGASSQAELPLCNRRELINEVSPHRHGRCRDATCIAVV